MATNPELMREWAELQRELAEVQCLSVSFKDRAYVEKYRKQKLKPEKEYATHTQDRYRDPEFTPFAWPLLEEACRVGDEFNVRALIANRGFDSEDTEMLDRCVIAAAKRGDESILRCLIHHGASPNATVSYRPVQEYSQDGVTDGNAQIEEEEEDRNLYTETALSAASRKSHDRVVVALLDLGANPLAKPYALLLACESGNLASCNSIYRWLEKHAKDRSPVMLLNSFGQNAVHRAALYAHIPVLEFLLSRAADINEKDNEGRTPLMLAVGSTTECERRSRLSTVKYLLSQGATCGDIYDMQGDTPLLMSFFIATRTPRRGKPRKLTNQQRERIQKAQAKPIGQDLEVILPEEDEARLAAASDKSYDELVANDRLSVDKYLLSILNTEDQARANALGENILCIASKYDNEDFVRLALASPAASIMINARTVRGESALHLAARSKSVRVVYLLRSAGADRNFRSRDGMSALAVAVSTGDPDIMDALLSPTPLLPSPVGTPRARRWEHGGGATQYPGLAKVNHGIDPEHLREALFVAARFGKSSLIVRLVERYKVDVFLKDPDGTGNTCLHVAVMHRQHHALNTLKRRGVPVGAKNNAGMTAEALASKISDLESLEILRRSFV